MSPERFVKGESERTDSPLVTLKIVSFRNVRRNP